MWDCHHADGHQGARVWGHSLVAIQVVVIDVDILWWQGHGNDRAIIVDVLE